MTLIEKFDSVLKSLYDISGNRPTFGRIMALLRFRKKDIHFGEVWDILNKMRRDGIIREQIFQNTIRGIDKEIYLITFEGKLMNERGGLKWKLLRERFEKIWVSAVTILTVIISVLTFYYVSKGVSDDTLNKVNETLLKELPKHDSLIKLENHKLKMLQNIVDSVYKKK